MFKMLIACSMTLLVNEVSLVNARKRSEEIVYFTAAGLTNSSILYIDRIAPSSV